MAKISTLQPAVVYISGKAARKDKVYFRKAYGKTIMVRVDNPYTGPLTDDQKAINTKFTTIQAQVKALPTSDPEKYAALSRKFKNQRKYVSLNGYIFAQLWREAQQANSQGD
ncbi:MAG TPA: hypothetical protein DEO38_06515 [Bacteroidales bacterium]|jgi:hypothetical protein|nr:hypothetical protein [Bacteroidales bacterium]